MFVYACRYLWLSFFMFDCLFCCLHFCYIVYISVTLSISLLHCLYFSYIVYISITLSIFLLNCLYFCYIVYFSDFLCFYLCVYLSKLACSLHNYLTLLPFYGKLDKFFKAQSKKMFSLTF